MKHVAISGRGMAANGCAYLLGRAGFTVARSPSRRAPVPAILLSDAAQELLHDVFDRSNLFAGAPRITRRFVAWGDAEPVMLPHEAIVLSEQDLDEAFDPGPGTGGTTDCDLTIHTAAPFPHGDLRSFGTRPASAAPAILAHAEDNTACWIESVAHGWLFLIPGGDHAWLLAVGGQPDALLGESRHIAARVAALGPATASFETAPRMRTHMQGEDWLACGTAAIAFDPICGDGTAQAMREAIMASAVIGAIAEGEDPLALHTHYESMMIAAMRRHLRLCAQFYETGGKGAWWQAQMAGLVEGFDWCTARLARLPEPRFALHGFRLVAREQAA